MANIAYVYRIYPTKEQIEQINKTIGCARFVYNQMFTIQQDKYKNGEKYLSKNQANDLCNHQLKNDYPFLREVDKFALTNSIYHLDNAYDRFFKKLGKFPKYKSKHKTKLSYTTNFTNNNIIVEQDRIKLPKLKWVIAKTERLPKKDWVIKQATITNLRDGSYHVSVLFEYKDIDVQSKEITPDTTIGLDYKSDGLYVDSNNHRPDTNKYYRQSQDKLAKRQRNLKHKQVGSNNYYKQQKKIAKIHRKIANQRKDFLQKESTSITKKYTCIVVEDLDMKSMSNKDFGNGKATLDNGYGMFLKMLDYKTKREGGALIKVDKWYASSQICYCCGQVHKEMKELSKRKLVCNCGYQEDRDYNSAKNIKREGLRMLGVC